MPQRNGRDKKFLGIFLGNHTEVHTVIQARPGQVHSPSSQLPSFADVNALFWLEGHDKLYLIFLSQQLVTNN